jgi:transposase
MSNTEKTVKNIRHNTRRKFSTEEKIRIVLDGLRGEREDSELSVRRTLDEIKVSRTSFYRWIGPT